MNSILRAIGVNPPVTLRGHMVVLTSHTSSARELDTLVAQYACALGYKPFEWHVPLVRDMRASDSSIESVQYALEIAHIFPRHVVQVYEVGYCPGHPFRSLYLRLFDEDHWLRALTTITAGCYPHLRPPPFWHIPLCYGALSSLEREALIEGADEFLGKVVPMTHVEVWRTEGAVDEWKKLYAYPLCISP
jgi:hypothetical protein